jgi:HAE1 family hydrophobic/amphiphilic exporter-1
MSVATTVFAMIPLVLFPGAGSELYRGLGSVVLGGLIVSTLFTLILIPAAFGLITDIKKNLSLKKSPQKRYP